MDVNPEFADDILLETRVTTQVENLHAVSHFKHETFMVLQYAKTLKQSRERVYKAFIQMDSKVLYLRQVVLTILSLNLSCSFQLFPSEGITPGMEEQMVKELQIKPVRQRTFRSETTKDKTGAFPSTVYFCSTHRQRV